MSYEIYVRLARLKDELLESGEREIGHAQMMVLVRMPHGMVQQNVHWLAEIEVVGEAGRERGHLSAVREAMGSLRLLELMRVVEAEQRIGVLLTRCDAAENAEAAGQSLRETCDAQNAYLPLLLLEELE